MEEDYLDVTSRTQFDDSVTRVAYHSYVPHNTLTINNSDEIRIAINNQDLITLPSRSYLFIKGKMENHDKGHLTMNAFAFLFDEINYEVAGKIVDSIRNPGIASLMKLICSMDVSSKYTNSAIDNDDNLKTLHKDGHFSGCIPLNMLMGVFEDFTKCLVNVKQEIILKRAKSDKNCILKTGDAAPTIKLSEIQWVMPHVTPSDSEKLTLQKLLLQNKMLQIAFRSFELHELPSFPQTTKHTWAVKTSNQLEKPRYVIFGFQTGRNETETKRTDQFDHCQLKNLRVYLNSDYYPYNDLNLDFDTNDVSKAFDMFLRFTESYYKTASVTPVHRKEFITKYPLIVIDMSKQVESVKEGVVDIKLEIETKENVPEHTTAYCLIIHDKLFEYNPMTSEINKM